MAAQDAERAATETLTEAKKRLAAAEASGDSTAIASATRSVTVATNNLTAASGQVADFGTQVQDASSKPADLHSDSQQHVQLPGE